MAPTILVYGFKTLSIAQPWSTPTEVTDIDADRNIVERRDLQQAVRSSEKNVGGSYFLPQNGLSPKYVLILLSILTIAQSISKGY